MQAPANRCSRPRPVSPLRRDAVERRIHLAAARAEEVCPSLAGKHVATHTLRHTAAMRLLDAGVDTTVIALWLGS